MFDFKKTVGFVWIRYAYLNRIEKISTTLNWQIGGSSYLFSFNLISLGFELLLGVVQPLQLYASEHFPKTSYTFVFSSQNLYIDLRVESTYDCVVFIARKIILFFRKGREIVHTSSVLSIHQRYFNKLLLATNRFDHVYTGLHEAIMKCEVKITNDVYCS